MSMFHWIRKINKDNNEDDDDKNILCLHNINDVYKIAVKTCIL